ncbi:MAG: hypothetical protein Q9179_000387 [Wetmoreana sp. 5 TL-2023]
MGHCSKEELKRLCEVCSTLQGIALPRLYGVVQFISEHYESEFSHPMQRFTHTVLHNWEKASKIKSLELVNNCPRGYWIDLDLVYDPELLLTRQLKTTPGFPLAEEMFHCLGAGGAHVVDATVALLLCLLPNLQILRLGVCLSDCSDPLEPKYIPAMLRHILSYHDGMNLSHQLQALQEIEWLGHHKYIWFEEPKPPFADALWLFYIPNIKSITARMVEREEFFHWPQLAPIRPSMQSVILHTSCVRITTLRSLLLATPRLKRLEYHHSCDYESSFTLKDCKVVDCKKLKEALEPLSASLEDLTLSINFYSYDIHDKSEGDNADYGISCCLGDLTGFTKLRYLQAPLVMLLGWDPPSPSMLEHSLPQQLSVFCCSNDLCRWYIFNWKHEDVLRQVIPLIQKRGTALTRFIAGAEDGRWLWWPKVREPVKAACEEAGIIYDTIESPYPD